MIANMLIACAFLLLSNIVDSSIVCADIKEGEAVLDKIVLRRETPTRQRLAVIPAGRIIQIRSTPSFTAIEDLNPGQRGTRLRVYRLEGEPGPVLEHAGESIVFGWLGRASLAVASEKPISGLPKAPKIYQVSAGSPVETFVPDAERTLAEDVARFANSHGYTRPVAAEQASADYRWTHFVLGGSTAGSLSPDGRLAAIQSQTGDGYRIHVVRGGAVLHTLDLKQRAGVIRFMGSWIVVGTYVAGRFSIEAHSLQRAQIIDLGTCTHLG